MMTHPLSTHAMEGQGALTQLRTGQSESKRHSCLSQGFEGPRLPHASADVNVGPLFPRSQVPSPQQWQPDLPHSAAEGSGSWQQLASTSIQIPRSSLQMYWVSHCSPGLQETSGQSVVSLHLKYGGQAANSQLGPLGETYVPSGHSFTSLAQRVGGQGANSQSGPPRET